MKFLCIIITLLISLNIFAEEQVIWSPEGRKRESDQVKLWQSNLEKSVPMQSAEKIEFLSLGLRNMAYRKDKSDHSLAVDGVYKQIQNVMLSIPGHAEYYRDRVLKAQADYRDEVVSNISGAKYNDYITEQSTMGSTLEQLPSPETVRVLGEFLADGWVSPNSLNLPLSSRIAPMSLSAVCTFANLPLASKPASNRHYHEAEGALSAWQSWYEQIKANKRTFRFEGDPTEYDLNGPAPKEKLVRIERDRKRDQERLTGQKNPDAISGMGSVDTSLTKPSIVGGVIASLALLLAVICYFLKCRKISNS